MGDSQELVNKRAGYDQWTKGESKALLDIMVDATSRGWHKNGGIFSKKIVKDRILPLLNSKLGCEKNYKNYLSRLKWFRKRWLSYSTLLEFNYGFGFDSTTKRFTATNELWDKYLQDHPKNGNLRNEVFDDYEDLKFVIGNGCGVRNSIRVRGVTDASAPDVGEGRYIADLDYNDNNEEFEGPGQNDSPPVRPLEVRELPKKQLLRKRFINEYDGSSNFSGNALQSGISEPRTKLTRTFKRTYTSWDGIKEVPDLDDSMRLNAFKLLDTETKKDGFLSMTLEERKQLITNNMQQ